MVQGNSLAKAKRLTKSSAPKPRSFVFAPAFVDQEFPEGSFLDKVELIEVGRDEQGPYLIVRPLALRLRATEIQKSSTLRPGSIGSILNLPGDVLSFAEGSKNAGPAKREDGKVG